MSRRSRKRNRDLKRAEIGREEKTRKVMPESRKPVRKFPKGGLIVYGAGDHLKDMLIWHKDLADRIVRIIDKDEAKIGSMPEGLYCEVEPPEVLKEMPAGTQIAVSALRYYSEIVRELHELNPGLVCPDIDQAYVLLRQAESQGIIVYGVGDHLADMLSWHPELKDRISRIYDKDEKKQGQLAPGTDRLVEAPEGLKRMPAGTRIAVSAIRYLFEIAEDLYALNPGLICQNIDDSYKLLPPLPEPEPVSPPTPTVVPAPEPVVVIHRELTTLQSQRLRGKAAAERWRRKFLMECANVRKVFWGTQGVRAAYLRKEFQSFMGKKDIFIEENLSLRGQIVNGLPVCIPDVLKDIRGRFVIIVLSDNYPWIRERLMDYGYVENVDFVEGRQLLGEDEQGDIDVPCIEKKNAGMIVYGQGAHLTDMLNWHPELAGHISRIIDKDPQKTGSMVPEAGVNIEPFVVLKYLPTGTEIAVSAIKYLEEIEKDIHAVQPGLICRNIDEVWQEYV